MSMSASLHNPTISGAVPLDGCPNDNLKFAIGADDRVNIFCPPHVAEHTAAAFNRAMQAVPVKGGFDYKARSGVWHISQVPTGHKLYQFQHNDIDVASPGYMHGTERSIIAAMDEIDELEIDHICHECNRLAGLDNLMEVERGKYIQMLCKRCIDEKADDDKAHAWAERASE